MRLLTSPSTLRPSPALRPSARPSPSPVRRPAVVAHRGASEAAPENTLAAVRAALAVGADHVEVDVQRTRDGALVVVHDTTLDRTTDAQRVLGGAGPYRVADLTLAQVRRLDAGSWLGPSHAGEQVPTLPEVVDLLRGTGTGLLLEVKAAHLYPGIAADVAHDLRSAPGYVDDEVAAGRLVVQSFEHDVVREVKMLLPVVPVGLLGLPPARHLPRLAGWADQVNPPHRAATAAYVEAVHAAGMRCQVWTVNRRADLLRAVDLGVDGIITNRPHVLQRLLATREALLG